MKCVSGSERDTCGQLNLRLGVSKSTSEKVDMNRNFIIEGSSPVHTKCKGPETECEAEAQD